MGKLGILAIWAAAMFAGRQLAGAAHELGHALVTLALGGRVDSIQPWPVMGAPLTEVSGLSTLSRAVVDISGIVAVTGIAVAALALIPWRKLSAVTASALAVFLAFFLVGVGSFAYHAFSTGANDAANFVQHSGASRQLVFIVAAGAFIAVLWLYLNRTEVASSVVAAWSGPGEQDRPRIGYATAALLLAFFLAVSFLVAGKPQPYNRVPVGLAVLLDGIAIQNTDRTSGIQDGEARVRHAGEWFTAGFGHVEPGRSVSLFYSTFTNGAGATLPAEIYSPSEIRILSPGYSTHHYRAEVNGQNPRVSAQWSNRLAVLQVGKSRGD